MKQVIARKSKIYYLYIGMSIFFVLFGIFLIYMTFLIGKIGRTELQDIFLTISLSVTTFGAAFIFIFLSLRIARIPEELIVLEGNILYCYYDKAMVPIPLAEIFSANYQLYPRSCCHQYSMQKRQNPGHQLDRIFSSSGGDTANEHYPPTVLVFRPASRSNGKALKQLICLWKRERRAAPLPFFIALTLFPFRALRRKYAMPRALYGFRVRRNTPCRAAGLPDSREISGKASLRRADRAPWHAGLEHP